MVELEAKLIRQAQQGDAQAFGRLVGLYQDRLYAAMVHLTGCPAEAEDVVQETFVQAYLKLSGFRGDSRFYTWLYRVAIRQAARRQRKTRREVSLDASLESSGSEPSDDGPSPENDLIRAERRQTVQAALARLPDDSRAILVLREIEQFDYATISQILDVPIGTVRSRLHRARVQLRDRMNRMGEMLQGAER